METAKTDKFYVFLCAALEGVSTLLDIALANDVTKVTFYLVSNAMDKVDIIYSILKRYVPTC